MATNFLVYVAGFASQLLVAWILTPAQLGQIKTMQAITGIATLIAGLGLTTSTLILGSAESSLEEKRIYFQYALKYTIRATVLVWIGLECLAFSWTLSPDPAVNRLYIAYSVSVFPTTVTALMVVYLQALKQFRTIALVNAVTKLTTVFLIIISTYRYGINGYIAGYILGCLTTLICLNAKIATKDCQASETARPLAGIGKKHFDLAKFACFDLVMGQLTFSLDILIANYLIKDRGEFGQYSFVITIVTAYQFLIGTVQQVATPYLVAKNNNRKQWCQVVRKYNYQLAFFAILVGILSLVIMPQVVGWVFHHKYQNFGKYFVPAMIAWVLRASYSLFGPEILSLKKTNLNLVKTIVKTLVSLVIYYFSILKFGLIGAAYASVLINLIGFLLEYVSLRFSIRQYFAANKLSACAGDSQP